MFGSERSEVLIALSCPVRVVVKVLRYVQQIYEFVQSLRDRRVGDVNQLFLCVQLLHDGCWVWGRSNLGIQG